MRHVIVGKLQSPARKNSSKIRDNNTATKTDSDDESDDSIPLLGIDKPTPVKTSELMDSNSSSPDCVSGADASNEADSMVESSLDSSVTNPSFNTGQFGENDGKFPSVAIVMPTDNSTGRSLNHDPYFQFNHGRSGSDDGSQSSPAATPSTRRLNHNLNGIKLNTLWESEGLDSGSETEMSTPAPSYATSTITSPKDHGKGHALLPPPDPPSKDGNENTDGLEDANEKDIPEDIAIDDMLVSPLSISKGFQVDSDVKPTKSLLPPPSPTERSMSSNGESSTDSAIDFLHRVQEHDEHDEHDDQIAPKSSNTTTKIGDVAIFDDDSGFGMMMQTGDANFHTVEESFESNFSLRNQSPRSFEGRLILNRFEVDVNADALYLSKAEVVLAAYDRQSQRPVALKLMNNIGNFHAELEGRVNLDPQFVLPVHYALVDSESPYPDAYKGDINLERKEGIKDNLGIFVTELVKKTSDSGIEETKSNMHDFETEDTQQPREYPYVLVMEAYNATLADTLGRRTNVTCALARKIARDIVVALILLHTENKFHGNVSTHSIVRVGSQWKLKDLCMSRSVGDNIDMKRVRIAHCPPEVATKILESNGLLEVASCKFAAQTEYDLWSLGTVMYALFLGSSLWNSDSHGFISSVDLASLARWSPQSFLRMAYLYFPPDERSDDERAAIDLISKLLMPTADDRKTNFEFGIVSVHQHEFLEAQPLEAESLVAFGERQAVMLRSETEHNHFNELTKSLSLEEKWELNRSRDVLLTGLFETTDVHTPTSFVVLSEKLGPIGVDESEEVYQRRLDEGLKWISLFQELGPFVKGSLDGDVSSVGHFWAHLKKHFNVKSYVYFYFVDDMTGEPVRGKDNNRHYPLEIKVRSDLFPKLVPLMQVTMRSMALYHGVAGIARMFGCPRLKLTQEMRLKAQEKTNLLKDENSASPFGVFADDIKKLRLNKEQFLKGESVRCKSLRVLVRFLDKKIGCDGDFAGLKRLGDKDGQAVWTSIDDTTSMKHAIQKREQERLCEEKNLWQDSQDFQINTLQKNLTKQKQNSVTLANSLAAAQDTIAKLQRELEGHKSQAVELEALLIESQNKLKAKDSALEKEKSKMKLHWMKKGSKKKRRESLIDEEENFS